MATEVRVAPVELAKLAGETLTASKQLARGYRDDWKALAVPQSAFGNTVGGAEVYLAHETVLSESETTVARLVVVQQGDVDRLYRVAFVYKKVADDAALRIRYGP